MHYLSTFLCLFLAHFAFATNYYVSANLGKDANDGRSPAMPFATLDFAAQATQPGDTVFIMNGIYANSNDQAVFKIHNAGSAEAWIVYTAMDGHYPKLKFDSYTAIHILGTSYIEITGLTIEGPNDETDLTFALSNYKNGEISKTQSTGIQMQPHNGAYPHHIRLIKNTIYKCGGSGIESHQADYLHIENNAIYECGWYSPFQKSGIMLYQNKDIDDHTGVKNFIRCNWVHSNNSLVPGKHDDAYFNGHGIFIHDFQHNYADNSSPYRGKTLIENNIVFNNGGGGIYACKSDQVWVTNNTCYKNSTNPAHYHFEIGGTNNQDFLVYNNILISEQDGGYNCIGCEDFRGGYNLVNQTDAYTFEGINDMVPNNPLFVLPSIDGAIADFSLQQESPAINTAFLDKSPTDDFFGKTRGPHPDIGAIESPDIPAPVCSGGMVMGDMEQTIFTTCFEDGEADIIHFFNSNNVQEGAYAYIITDQDGKIKAIEQEAFDFDTGAEGTYLVYGVAYRGELNISLEQPISTLSANTACFDLSDNFLTIYRKKMDSYVVRTIDGATEMTIQDQEDHANLVQFKIEIADELNHAFLLLNEENTILAISEVGFDFEDRLPGVYFVEAIIYTGNLNVAIGQNAHEVVVSDGCTTFSTNVIRINKEEAPEILVNAGTISLAEGIDVANFCVGDGQEDLLTFTNNGSVDAAYVYVVTNVDGAILNFSKETVINFDDAPVGTCFVTGVSYTGKIQAEIGDELLKTPFSDESFAFSAESIPVRHIAVDGGTIQSLEGPNIISLQMGDGLEDIVTIEHNSESTEAYAYLLVNAQEEIISFQTDHRFDFKDLASGQYYIYGLSYSGNILTLVGENLGSTPFSDGCYELSTTKIQVDLAAPIAVHGGTVSLTNSLVVVNACVNIGHNRDYELTHITSSEASYTYILTDENNRYLAKLDSNIANFENAIGGFCFVKGVSYTGNILAEPGDDLSNTPFATGDFAFSENVIAVNRIAVDGGEVTAANGSQGITLCKGEGVQLVPFIYTTNSMEEYTLTVIDDKGTLVNIPEGMNIDFSDFSEGLYFVRGVSYTGDITVMVGNNTSDIPFSDGCFEHSGLVSVKIVDASNDCLSTSSTTLDYSQIPLSFAPNPTSEVLYIHFDNEYSRQNNGLIEIFNGNGQRVHQQTNAIFAGQNQLAVDVTELKTGIYLVKIQMGDFWGYGKFLKIE